MFRDRRDAGILLAERLLSYKEKEGVLVLALPRGGVVTGFEIARRLDVPLDVLIVRKIGFPGQPELAIGAVSETGTVVLNQSIVTTYNVSDEFICLETPIYFIAVGNYYYDFSQISDEEVEEILKVSVSEDQSKDK